jgi:hypothetical protein
MKTEYKALLFVACGIIISLVSGLYSQDLSVGVGATKIGYGFPLHWVEKTTIVVPDAPTTFSLYWLGLLADITSWTLITGAAYTAYKQTKK